MSSSPSALSAAAAAAEDEPNDSPAFRLRPRRAAPKSYYTVRLEYSANPSAFIRERPRTNSKRKVFSSKTGSQRSSSASGPASSSSLKLANVLSKEERELEARRLLLQREISESITSDKLISPFMQRLSLNELSPDSIYEHNYVTLRLKKIGRSTNGQLAHCLCESIDQLDNNHDYSNQIMNEDSDTDIEDEDAEKTRKPSGEPANIAIRLYNEYAQTPLLKPEKLISIAKFKTTPAMPWQSQNDDTLDERSASSSDAVDSSSSTKTTNVKDKSRRLPFMIIVKYDELPSSTTTTPNKNSFNVQQSSGAGLLVEAAASSGRVSHDGASANKTNMLNTTTTTTTGNNKNKRRPLIPFISITDMIESVEEPFVEMGPSSPAHTSNFAASNSRYGNNKTNNYNNDLIKCENYQDEEEEEAGNKESKKIKFTGPMTTTSTATDTNITSKQVSL